jgi:DNA-binding HxlR family transcriptional regulator
MKRWRSRLADLTDANEETSPVGVQIGQIGQKPEQATAFGQFAHIAQDQGAPPKTGPMRQESLAKPTGRWMLLVQHWGGSVEEAIEIVTRVCVAAGAIGTLRRARVGDLFERMATRHSWLGGRRKIEWLEDEAASMEADPMYWPRSRPDLATSNVRIIKRILSVLESGPKTKSEIRRATRITLPSLRCRLARLVREGAVKRIRPGLYDLSRDGARSHVPVSHAVVELLKRGPMKFLELKRAVGRAIDRPVDTLRKNGVLAPGDRGPVRLSIEAFAKIERGEIIRSKRGDVIWAPDAPSNLAS